MIKIEITIDENRIYCNDMEISEHNGEFCDYFKVNGCGYFGDLESAVKYCSNGCEEQSQ